MSFIDELDDVNLPQEVDDFDKRRRREIIEHSDRINLEDWLLINFKNQIMRFGLAADMGDVSVGLDDQLIAQDRPRAYAKAWVNALADTWPLDGTFHGIPLHSILKIPLLKALEKTDAVEAVFLVLDCIPQHFEDVDLNLALVKIQGSLLEAMSHEHLTREHYFAAVQNFPDILGKLDNRFLDKELVNFACRLIPWIILDVDPVWQTQELVDDCLMDNFTLMDFNKISEQYLNNENLLLAIKHNRGLYPYLPEVYRNDKSIIDSYLSNYPGGFQHVPRQYVTLEIAGKGIAQSPSNAKLDFSTYCFTREDALIEACKYNADFLNYADIESLTENVLNAAVDFHALSIGYFRDGIDNVDKYYVKAVLKDALAITYVPTEKRQDILRQVRRLNIQNDTSLDISF